MRIIEIFQDREGIAGVDHKTAAGLYVPASIARGLYEALRSLVELCEATGAHDHPSIGSAIAFTAKPALAAAEGEDPS